MKVLNQLEKMVAMYSYTPVEHVAQIAQLTSPNWQLKVTSIPSINLSLSCNGTSGVMDG